MAKTEQHRLDCSGCTYSTAWEFWVLNFATTAAINHEMLGDAHVVTISQRVFDGSMHHLGPSFTLQDLARQRGLIGEPVNKEPFRPATSVHLKSMDGALMRAK
jgi:hypothetical protein